MSADVGTQRLMKVRRIVLCPEILVSRLLAGKALKSNLPADARYINCGLDTSLGRGCHRLVLLVWSESFEGVEEGKVVPEFELLVTEA